MKGNFLAGRTFYDDADLEHERAAWLHHVNDVRPSDATEQLPRVLLADEQPQVWPAPRRWRTTTASLTACKVSRESMVALATNRYSVPAHLVGLRADGAHLCRPGSSCSTAPSGSRPTRASLDGMRAWSCRNTSRRSLPASRARASWSTATGWSACRPLAADYISRCSAASAMPRWTARSPRCTRWRSRLGREAFLAALELAAEQQTIGAEYVRRAGRTPRPPTSTPSHGCRAC